MALSVYLALLFLILAIALDNFLRSRVTASIMTSISSTDFSSKFSPCLVFPEADDLPAIDFCWEGAPPPGREVVMRFNWRRAPSVGASLGMGDLKVGSEVRFLVGLGEKVWSLKPIDFPAVDPLSDLN